MNLFNRYSSIGTYQHNPKNIKCIADLLLSNSLQGATSSLNTLFIPHNEWGSGVNGKANRIWSFTHKNTLEVHM